MKKLYTVIVFLLFFNIFCFLFASLNIFPTNPGTSDINMTSSETFIYDLSNYNISSIFNLLFFDTENPDWSSIASILALSAAGVLAVSTRNPSPFVVMFIANFMFNLYRKSMPIFNQFQINQYFMMAGLVGMVMLFIITSLEVLTHGDV